MFTYEIEKGNVIKIHRDLMYAFIFHQPKKQDHYPSKSADDIQKLTHKIMKIALPYPRASSTFSKAYRLLQEGISSIRNKSTEKILFVQMLADYWQEATGEDLTLHDYEYSRKDKTSKQKPNFYEFYKSACEYVKADPDTARNLRNVLHSANPIDNTSHAEEKTTK